MKIPTSVAIKSCHGNVVQNRNGNWNPFPTNRLINVVCEKPLIARTERFKRQAGSGLTSCRGLRFKDLSLYTSKKRVDPLSNN